VKKTAAAKKTPGRKTGSKAKAGAKRVVAAAPQTSTVQAGA
jgi:hypothetical protein